MTETPKTTRPSRARAKATAPVDTTIETVEIAPEAPAGRTVIELEHIGDTPRYEKWGLPTDPESTVKPRVTGTIYAPKGTQAVKVLVQE